MTMNRVKFHESTVLLWFTPRWFAIFVFITIRFHQKKKDMIFFFSFEAPRSSWRNQMMRVRCPNWDCSQNYWKAVELRILTETRTHTTTRKNTMKMNFAVCQLRLVRDWFWRCFFAPQVLIRFRLCDSNCLVGPMPTTIQYTHTARREQLPFAAKSNFNRRAVTVIPPLGTLFSILKHRSAQQIRAHHLKLFSAVFFSLRFTCLVHHIISITISFVWSLLLFVSRVNCNSRFNNITKWFAHYAVCVPSAVRNSDRSFFRFSMGEWIEWPFNGFDGWGHVRALVINSHENIKFNWIACGFCIYGIQPSRYLADARRPTDRR